MAGMNWLIIVAPIVILLVIGIMAFSPVIGRRLPPHRQADDALRGEVTGGVVEGEKDPQRDEIPRRD